MSIFYESDPFLDQQHYHRSAQHTGKNGIILLIVVVVSLIALVLLAVQFRNSTDKGQTAS